MMLVIPGIFYLGKISEFGGPTDKYVRPDEGVALYNRYEECPDLFLPEQPPVLETDIGYSGLTTGLARRLNPEAYYCAMRWNYTITPKEVLRRAYVLIETDKNEKLMVHACPVDFGPGRMHRIIDVSKAVMTSLKVETDEVVKASLQLSPIDAFKN